MTVGTRAQVFHDPTNTLKTAGGLTHKDLKKNPNGKIVSIQASKAAKERLKQNPSFAAFVKHAGKGGEFNKSPKSGTKEYKKIMKKAKKNNTE